MTISTTTASQTSNDELPIDLGGSELKVLFKPSISAELKKVIEDNIEPSMASLDGSFHQYEPSEISEFINGNDDAASGLSDHDFKVVDALNGHYDYIEIG